MTTSKPKDVILVLIDQFNNESFSKFQVVEVDGVLLGTNIDYLPVSDHIVDTRDKLTLQQQAAVINAAQVLI